MDKRPLGVISVFFIIGIVLGRFLPDSITLLQVFVVTLIFITLTLTLPPLLKLRRTSSPKLECVMHVFLFLSIISLGSLLYLNSSIFPSNHISNFLGKDKLKAEIIGVIKSPAERRDVYYGKVSSRYVFEVEEIRGEGWTPYHSLRSGTGHGVKGEEWQGVSGLALVRIDTERDYQYGDRLLIKGTIKKPIEITNYKSQIPNKFQDPNGQNSKPDRNNNFNYREYLENQNIFALINTSEKNITLLSRNYKSNFLLRFSYSIREKLKNRFLEKMPLESGAFLRAILLGDRSELPKQLNESFRNSGTMHILPLQCRRKYNFSPENIITL